MNATNLLNHLSIPGSLCCEPVIGDHVGRTAITIVRVEVARVQCIDLGREVCARGGGVGGEERCSDRKGMEEREGSKGEEKGMIEEGEE